MMTATRDESARSKPAVKAAVMAAVKLRVGSDDSDAGERL